MRGQLVVGKNRQSDRKSVDIVAVMLGRGWWVRRERGGRGPTKLYVYKSVAGGTVCTAGHKSHWLPSEVYTLSTPAETHGENQYQTKCVQTSKLWTEISPSHPCQTCLIVQTFIIIQRNSFTVGSLVLSKEKWNKKKPNKEKQNFL